MASTFGPLELGLRSLIANQVSLQTTGQNVANVNTPGYSRQRAVLNPTSPYTYPSLNSYSGPGQIGTGVQVVTVERLRDSFIDQQIVKESSYKGYWDMRQSILEHVEVIFNEGGDTGLNTAMDNFLESLEEKLALYAENTTVRTTFTESAISLTDSIRSMHKLLSDLQKDVDGKIPTLVGQVNTFAEQIADLNATIAKVTAAGQNANDLMDQRDYLVQQLSELTEISVSVDSLNRYNISINGSMLVSGKEVSKLAASDTDSDGFTNITWEETGIPATIRRGKIGSYLELRDEDIQGYLDDLNTMAETLASEFNAVHRSGYGLDGTTGLDFFDYTPGNAAATIKVSQDIIDHPEWIAASVNDPTAPGSGSGEADGDNAERLADVFDTTNYASVGNITIRQFYDNVIARLGVTAATANTNQANQESMVQYLQQRQESIAGVYMDEEITNLLKFQNAYQATSRYITTIDQALDKLINGTGIVGL